MLFEKLCHEAELNEQSKRSINVKNGSIGYNIEKSDLNANYGTSGNMASTSSLGDHGTSGNMPSTFSQWDHGSSGKNSPLIEKEESNNNSDDIILNQEELAGSMYAEPLTEIVYRSTIPHVLAVLAAIDIVGYLISDRKDAKETAMNIKDFLIDKVDNENELNCLIFLFRHGMSHSFFPKKKVAIKAHSTNPKSSLFFIDSNSVLTLNANFIIEIMKEKFDSIIRNEELFPKMEKQFQKLQEADEKKLTNKYNLDIEKFKEQLVNLSTEQKDDTITL